MPAGTTPSRRTARTAERGPGTSMSPGNGSVELSPPTVIQVPRADTLASVTHLLREGRDLPEGVGAVCALLAMLALDVTTWLAILLAAVIYAAVTLLRPRFAPVRPEPVLLELPNPGTESIVDPTPMAAFAAQFGLTPRECELLPYLAHRMTDREIADRLYKSPKTVMNQTASILGKLELGTRREVAEFLSRHGLSVPPIPPKAERING
jgi:DNA-binding CsgD family transcriptional regulator